MCLAVISGLNAALALNERLQDPIACLKKNIVCRIQTYIFLEWAFSPVEMYISISL